MFKWDILLKSVFGGDGFRWPIRNDCIVVDAAGQLVQPGPISAKAVFERRELRASQLTGRSETEFFEMLLGYLADARNPANRKRPKECLDFFWLDDKQSIRLTPVGRNLCQELIGSNAG